MARLIAIDMPASALFVETVQRVWDKGDAVLPIDQRLPIGAKKLLLEAMAPSEIIDASFTASSLPNDRLLQDGDALVIASSGSTGSPKGIIHTHSSILAGAQASASRLQLSPNDTGLSASQFLMLVVFRSSPARSIPGLHLLFIRPLMRQPYKKQQRMEQLILLWWQLHFHALTLPYSKASCLVEAVLLPICRAM